MSRRRVHWVATLVLLGWLGPARTGEAQGGCRAGVGDGEWPDMDGPTIRFDAPRHGSTLPLGGVLRARVASTDQHHGFDFRLEFDVDGDGRAELFRQSTDGHEHELPNPEPHDLWHSGILRVVGRFEQELGPISGPPGPRALRFTAIDAFGNHTHQTCAVEIVPRAQNRRPRIEERLSVTPAGEPLWMAVNARDPDHGALSYEIVTPPMHGSLSGTPPDYLYQPEAGFVGFDGFEVRVDDSLDSQVGRLRVMVGDANSRPVIAKTFHDEFLATGQTVRLAIAGYDRERQTVALSAGPCVAPLLPHELRPPSTLSSNVASVLSDHGDGTATLTLRAAEAADRPCDIVISVSDGSFTSTERLRVRVLPTLEGAAASRSSAPTLERPTRDGQWSVIRSLLIDRAPGLRGGRQLRPSKVPASWRDELRANAWRVARLRRIVQLAGEAGDERAVREAQERLHGVWMRHDRTLRRLGTEFRALGWWSSR